MDSHTAYYIGASVKVVGGREARIKDESLQECMEC